MTAVASPPSLQPLPRLGWNSGNGHEGGLNSMSAEDVTRMFLPPKGPKRTNSSSSISSIASTSSSTSTSTLSSSAPLSRSDSLKAQADRDGWMQQKMTRGFWPSTKAETASAASAARPQPLPTQSLNGSSATSVLSTIHQPAPVLPSQNTTQTAQQASGSRTVSMPGGDPALLVLLPLNGTFERKQITVPLFPDVLKIGRQTNAKTVPTPLNGYFDSKVLSRAHAEIWADRNGKIWIRDVKSSNGTFVNGARLSPENRDSEAHELRESDTLELGIDIVSEDQKSIVHHKVSAKVEHAGVQSSTSSVLDLNFGDIDPGSGGGLMGPPFPLIQMRGRGLSQGSLIGSSRASGPQGVNGLGGQRQMNAWLSPIPIEQIVKRLGVELKSAKHQAQDLQRTSDYMNALLNNDLRQAKPESPAKILAAEPQTNGAPPLPKPDALSPFSQPPAPPPQQPLPEKPDSIRSIMSESSLPSSCKRIEVKNPRSINVSPVKPDFSSSQILSLVDALTSAKREIDSQGIRVLHLEDLLRQERKARENAEERARQLLERSRSLNRDHASNIEEDTFNPPPEDKASTSADQANGFNHDDGEDAEGAHSPSTKAPASNQPFNASASSQDTKDVEASTARLQARLDLMVRDMDEMKLQIESYKTRAEAAESERTSLAEMVQRIRATNASVTSNGLAIRSRGAEMASGTTDPSAHANGSAHPQAPVDDGTAPKFPSQTQSDAKAESAPSVAEMLQLQQALTATLAQRSAASGDTLRQSAPYASMLGVVLLGVGIMAYLNGWQNVER